VSEVSVNKDQIILTDFLTNLKFHYRRGQGHLFRYAKNRYNWYMLPKKQKVLEYPEHIDLELSSLCNMKCPMCYTITDEFKKKVPRKTMEWATLKKVLDEIGGGKVFSLRLSLRGEPTLHKDFIRVMKYAKEVGIPEVSSLTNALTLNEKMMREMIEAPLDWLTISADGVGETYNKIRKPAKFEDLIAKLKLFKKLKEEYKSDKPVIKIQSVWPAIQHNPQEYFDTYRPLVDQVASGQLVDYLGKDGGNQITYKENFTCAALYQRMIIGSDGTALMCHNDLLNDHPIGDVFSSTIKELWTNEKMRAARTSQERCTGVKDYKACQKCYLPRAMEEVEVVAVSGHKVEVNKYKGRAQEVGF
jgi:radical SAM protein with 4Fe4S-binding SPASM domain